MCEIIKMKSPLRKKRATRTDILEPFSPPIAPIGESQPFGFDAISDRHDKGEESFLDANDGVSENSECHTSDYDSDGNEK